MDDDPRVSHAGVVSIHTHMPRQPDSSAPPPEPLRFDDTPGAAPDPGAMACSQCSNRIESTYYEMDGRVLCAACRAGLAHSTDAGARVSRTVRALGFGLAAAVGGSLLYYGILVATGLEIGLVAIVVGFAVGKAVSVGSGGRGGWRYQAMAMALTYAAIVSTYVPFVMRGLASSDSAPQGIVIVFLIAAASPLLAGFGNIIGIFIIGIALYEAWKLNRGQAHSITGPYQVGQARTGELPASG